MQEKGLVMEVNKDQVILLTADGQFISSRLSGLCPQIGDEISIEKEKNHKGLWVSLSVLAAAAVFFITVFAGGLWNQFIIPFFGNGVVAYMTVDINPSVEFGLDKDDIVVTVRPLNEDGKVLLKGLALKGQPSDEAINVFVEAAAQKGYLAPEKKNQIIINISKKAPEESSTKPETGEHIELEKSTETAETTKPGQSDQEQVSSDITAKAEKTVKKQNLNVKIEVINTDWEVREKAEELKLSAGKYAILVEAKEAGLDIDVNSIKKLGVTKAIEKAGGNPEEIIKFAREEKNFSEIIKRWQTQLSEDLKEKAKEKANKEDKKGKEKNNPANKNPEKDKNAEKQVIDKDKEKDRDRSDRNSGTEKRNDNSGVKERDREWEKETDKNNNKYNNNDKERDKDNNKNNSKGSDKENNKNNQNDNRDKGKNDNGKIDNDNKKDKDKDKDKEKFKDNNQDQDKGKNWNNSDNNNDKKWGNSKTNGEGDGRDRVERNEFINHLRNMVRDFNIFRRSS